MKQIPRELGAECSQAMGRIPGALETYCVVWARYPECSFCAEWSRELPLALLQPMLRTARQYIHCVVQCLVNEEYILLSIAPSWSLIY